MRKLTFLSALLLSSASLFGQAGDRKGHNMKDVIPKDKIPAAPVLSPTEAINATTLQKGFSLEVVASEPQVINPVTMVFDGNGRMWVCEMTSYMPNIDGKNEEVAEGNISVLEDTDGDGKVDKKTVFLDDVILPRSIALVKGGILYADHKSLYFAEVLPGLKAGTRELVDKDYAKAGTLEHKPNTMLYGLDGWYYNAKSKRRYKSIPLNHEAPLGSKEIYKNKYFKMVSSGSELRGQWGLSMDDYGRLYHNSNSSPAVGEYLRPNSLMRNPGFSARRGSSARIGGTQVYPVRMNPGVNRAYNRGILKDIDKPNSKSYGHLKNFTAASGNTVYRGTNFPKEFYGSSWTPEPGGNLISVRKITEREGKLGGVSLYKEAEVLASTDERFRPVNLYTAPDGSLYIVDLYHGILQHRVFVSSYLRRQIVSRKLDKKNNTFGRIYRLRHAAGKLTAAPKMEGLSAAELVPCLAHDNGFWRDTARRLIVEANDLSVIPAIEKLLSSKNHLVVVNALWTLRGLNKVSLNAVKLALQNDHVKAKVSAIAVSEGLIPDDHVAMTAILSELADNSNYEIVLQVALSAGTMSTPQALLVLKKIVTSKNISKRYIREAIVSGLNGREKEFEALIADTNDKNLIKLLQSVGKKKTIATNFNKLSKSDQALFQKGKKNYFMVCFGCHGPDAQGIPNLAPPLVKSEWVNGDKTRLLSVMLRGLSGPITVNGKHYKLPAMMPGLATNPMFKDEDLAAIATYIRNHFGNKSGAVKASEVAKVRKATEGSAGFTEKDFK